MRGPALVKVWCDGHGATCAETLSVARQDVDAEMEKAGWSTSWGVKDFCPACSKEREGEGE